MVALSVPFTALADDEKSKTEPKGVPIQATLTAKKSEYEVDLGGKSAEEVRKQIRDAREPSHYPAAPEVDLALELKNTGDKEIRIWVGGDQTQLTLALKGTAAVNTEIKGLFLTQELRGPEVVTLAPGKSHKLEIKKLSYGHRGASHRSYWLAAGEYALTASYRTGVSPSPKDAKDAGEGFGQVTATSAPVKLKVKKK
jgi:hypothetical protein